MIKPVAVSLPDSLRKAYHVMHHLLSRRLLIGAVALIIGLVVSAALWAPGQISFASSDPLEQAWNRVRETGSYRFASDVTQTTTPGSSILNAGRTSQTDRFYLEGLADIDATAMEFRLWSDGGSLLQEDSSLAVRVADGKTYVQKNGGDWQESSEFTQAIAPAGDFMSYLAAARDVTNLGQEQRAGLTFTRYAFRIDGPTFALSVRQQLEEAMRQTGNVPAGVTFGIPVYYRDMTGNGELWVGEDGLPIRQILSLQFPEQDNEFVSAHITAGFSQFGNARVTPAAGAGAASTPLFSFLGAFAPNLGSMALVLMAALLMVVLVTYQRVRLLRNAVTLALIASFLAGPMFHSFRTTSFLDAQTAHAAEQQKQREEIALSRSLASPESVDQFDPSAVNSASFDFAGVDGSNEVSAFECRLDGGQFLPCASPKTYADLSNGPHLFEVRAIDDGSFVDPTPASFSWSVQVTLLQTFIDAAPSDPTYSRDASFAFSGSAGVTGFECALDGGAYSPCSSPQDYTGLSDGLHTFLVRGTDDADNKGAATRHTWRVENDIPTADDQFVTTFRDTAVDITLTASDSDALIYQLVGVPTHGFVHFIAPNVVRYEPNSGSAGLDSFTFRASDGQAYSAPATVTVLVNFEPVIAVDLPTQLVQYSDGIAPVTLSVTDQDSPGASLTISSVSWTDDGVNVYPGLPPQLSLSAGSNNADTIPGQATWLLSGTADLPIGTYIVTVVADDGVGGSITGEPVDITIQVTPEDIMVRFHGGNPRAVQVQTAGDDNSGPFELRVDVKELYPDDGTSALPGDVALANVAVTLVPIGPGGTAWPTDCTTELHDVDYDARLTVTCAFDIVPINTYAVEVSVDGSHYGGLDEDVVTVYDPSRGFTTGGGTFIWPGSSDETTFGFTIEYNKKGKNVQGRLMLIRRTPDGSHRIKSNALDGLALGAESAFTWASFSGKTTYRSPQMEQPEGNHTFIAYVEDHGETGDRFWLQVKDKDGNVIVALAMDEPGANNATPIDDGSIVVPGGGQ